MCAARRFSQGAVSFGRDRPLRDPQRNTRGKPLDPAIASRRGNDAARAVQRAACQAGRGFRFGLLLAAAAALRWGFGQVSREFPYRMCRSGSGTRSTPSRQTGKVWRSGAEEKDELCSLGGQGACPLLSLGVPKGVFSSTKRISPLNTPFGVGAAGCAAKQLCRKGGLCRRIGNSDTGSRRESGLC